MEDELVVRWNVSETLRDAGYTVIEAVDGDEALAIIETVVRLDLVFSDVKMPGSVDGLTLAALIKRSVPSLPVVVTSGHCDPALALAAGAERFVRKPYELNTVVALITEELEKSR